MGHFGKWTLQELLQRAQEYAEEAEEAASMAGLFQQLALDRLESLTTLSASTSRPSSGPTSEPSPDADSAASERISPARSSPSGRGDA